MLIVTTGPFGSVGLLRGQSARTQIYGSQPFFALSLFFGFVNP